MVMARTRARLQEATTKANDFKHIRFRNPTLREAFNHLKGGVRQMVFQRDNNRACLHIFFNDDLSRWFCAHGR